MVDRAPVISLGAGVQSSTLLLMAADGEFEATPEVAVFADTHAEPAAVYRWLDFLRRTAGERIPIHTCSAGDLRADVMAVAAGGSTRASQPPLFTRNPDGSAGLSPRKCTRDYKVRPIGRALRALGYGPKRPVEQWLGISTDEIERVKPSGLRWRENRWPLIERGLTRDDCLRWLAYHGYPEPPKSACTFCPYSSNARWRAMRDEAPEEWADAVELDRAIRHLPGMRSECFVHRDRVPLSDVDLATDDPDRLGDGFGGECEGLCGN